MLNISIKDVGQKSVKASSVRLIEVAHGVTESRARTQQTDPRPVFDDTLQTHIH